MCGIIDSIIQKILGRLSGLLTVSTGGILGFALWLGANYLLRRQRTRFQEARQSSVDTSHTGCENNVGTRDSNVIGKPSSVRSLASSLSRKKVSSIALSVTGVVTQEKSAAELSSKGATLIESSVSVLRELVHDMRKKVFLVCEVDDDIGEAVVLDSLEHAGLIGDEMIPRHRLVFCSCSHSKVSIIRQLEPSIYVDGNKEVCSELSRFMDSILLLQENTTLEEKLSSF